METTTSLPSFLDRFPAPTTQPKTAVRLRNAGLLSAALVAPAAYIVGRALGSPRTGVIAGGLALLGIGVLRWQLARWFRDTPAYETLAQIGELELRRYPFRIEARTDTDATDFESAFDAGFSRLECFVCGANSEHEGISHMTPVLTAMRGGRYTTSFVMPPRRSFASLPSPDDTRVELREVPERRIAVFPYDGKRDLAFQEREFLRALVDAGLAAKGSVTVATYDTPTTLPLLRRSELWIEVV
jgi:hypothetical protein